MAILAERTPSSPPVIAPVVCQGRRPVWSVMVPCYNCLTYLRDALEAVLAQDPGPELMQIMVVDDCSTDGDVRALVQAIGNNRVGYFRHDENRGSLRNFETCLNLSTGHWVHILHGDDRVVPGFYTEVESLFQRFPEAGAAFTNVAYWQSDLNKLHESRALFDEPGIFKDFLIANAQRLQLQPPSIVVKRAVYEQLGGFYAVHYGEDWEMWTRIGAHFPVAYSPKSLAHYRYQTANGISHQAIRRGENVHDIIKVIDIMHGYLPVAEREQVKRTARREYALYCVSLARLLYRTNPKAAMLQVRGALELSDDLRVYYALLKNMVEEVSFRTWIRKLYRQAKEVLQTVTA